jgi:2-iminoacetate synthase ThiH
MKLQDTLTDLAEFKENSKKIKAQWFRFDKSAYMNDLNNGTDDTSPTFKAFEEVKPCLKKQTHNGNSSKFIRDLKMHFPCRK